MSKSPLRAEPTAVASSKSSDQATPVAESTREDSSFVKKIVQHGLPIALAALTAFGVAGYAVGRAYLEGWYVAAGIPVLAFNWDLQYVVLRGLSADMMNLWLLEILTFAVMIALYGGFELALTKASEWRSRAKPRGMSPTASARGTSDRKVVSQWIKCIALAILLLCLAGAWFACSMFLNDIPRQRGVSAFVDIARRATCRDSKGEVSATDCAEEGRRLGAYPWVEIHSPSLDANVHGWLLQQQGSTLLLISRSGVNLLSFGDAPFRVSNVLIAGPAMPFDKSRLGAERRPQFKTEAPSIDRSNLPDATSRAPSSASPSEQSRGSPAMAAASGHHLSLLPPQGR